VSDEPEAIPFPNGQHATLAALIDVAPAGSVIEIAPGRFVGAVTINRPITLRGAGDLSRLSSEGRGAVVRINVAHEGRVVLESLMLEDGESESGGGLIVEAGRVRAYNVQIRRCRSEKGAGGAIAVLGGELDASLVRAHETSADRGGAVFVGGRGFLRLCESELRKSEARLGGAIVLEDAARATMEALTIGRARARTSSGGQAIYLRGGKTAHPILSLKRVRLEDAPMGMPLVLDPAYPGEVTIAGSDMPQVVASVPGVVDAGNNRWR
jgi:hypothetical protein